MTSRIKVLGILTGLGCIISTLGGGASAMAGSTGSGISIKSGTITPVGDPYYEFQFDIVLGVGDTLDNGGYITVYDLPSGTGNLTSQPNSEWGATVQNIGITPTGASVTDDPNLENVTWKYNGSAITNNGDTLESLGIFTIGPSFSNPVPFTVEYAGSTDGTNSSGQGSVTVYLVPEPSSFVLLLGASGVMLLPVLKQKRQQI